MFSDCIVLPWSNFWLTFYFINFHEFFVFLLQKKTFVLVLLLNKIASLGWYAAKLWMNNTSETNVVPWYLVSCPTRWSLYWYLDFCDDHLVGGGNPLWASVDCSDPCWGLEWRFWPNFFAKCIFYMHPKAATKKIANFFCVLPPQKRRFFRRGCLAGQISGIEGMPSFLEICSIRKSHWSQVGVPAWPLFRNWGHALISGKVQ